MATKEELYISIDQSTYIGAKSNILKCQEDMLNSMKHLYNLKVLTRLRNDLKKTLLQLSSSTQSEINEIQDKMPTMSVPKTLGIKEKAEVKEKSHKENFSKNWNIEAELKTIQEKLRELNS